MLLVNIEGEWLDITPPHPVDTQAMLGKVIHCGHCIETEDDQVSDSVGVTTWFSLQGPAVLWCHLALGCNINMMNQIMVPVSSF